MPLRPQALLILLLTPLAARPAAADLFDGARAAGPPRSAASISEPAAVFGRDLLLTRLLARVEFVPNEDPRANPALLAALAQVLETPTGRELAAAFVAEGASARVFMGELEGSAVVLRGGRKVLGGSGGSLDARMDPPLAVVNRHFLDVDPAYRRLELPHTLAHELLGHGLTARRAQKAGFARALDYYRGDEALAALGGWLVSLELGAPADDHWLRRYAESPEDYYRGLSELAEAYSVTLSPAQMRAPQSAWRRRLLALEGRLRRIEESAAEHRRRRRFIEHLISVHGRERAPWSALLEESDALLGYGAEYERRQASRAHWAVQYAIDGAGVLNGPAVMREMRAAANSPFVRACEARIADYERRLRARLAARPPAPPAASPAASATWADLDRLWDEEDPSHRDALR